MSQVYFDKYFESVYQHRNIFTPEQYELAADNFGCLYRGCLPADKGARILDVGCGGGHFLYFLNKSGYRDFQGIDVSPQQVEFCRKNVTERVEQADAFRFLDERGGTYDFIAAHAVLEHVPKDQVLPLAQKMHAALKPGGRLVIRVPNMSNPFAGHARYIDMTHELGFTESSLRQVLYMAGFRDIAFTGSLTLRWKSWRSLFRIPFVRLYYAWIRFLYYVQDFQVPRVLDHDLIAISRKDASTA
jgi:2-polyprenyl-3-methyl-5-hydroxy-6-metoxy-1,4-benzoquinol methylase